MPSSASRSTSAHESVGLGGVGDPQVQAGRTVGVNVEAGVGQGLEEEGASRGVDLPLVLDVFGVSQGEGHHMLNGGGHHEARVLTRVHDGGGSARGARR